MSFDIIVNSTMHRLDERVRAATIGVFSSVIRMTPVDTGRAKDNWQCTIGSPASGEAMTNETAMIATIPQHAGEKVYLTNNVPYIQKLEYGHSQQAPSGMVRISIDKFEGLMS